MQYTLTTWALWLIVAALIGAVIGWMLRGLRSRSPAEDVADTGALRDAAAGSSPMPSQAPEVERLRAKVLELEAVAIERDRLQWELSELRAANQVKQPSGGEALWSSTPPPDANALSSVTAERDEWASKAITYEQVITELRVRLWNSEARLSDLQAGDGGVAAGGAPPPPDIAAGALVLGSTLRLDDLTVVEGIGPKIAELCQARGITTWLALANTDVASLRDLLTAAGPKFHVQDPSTWPEQARLLATGQWVAFQSLAARVRGGRTAE